MIRKSSINLNFPVQGLKYCLEFISHLDDTMYSLIDLLWTKRTTFGKGTVQAYKHKCVAQGAVISSMTQLSHLSNTFVSPSHCRWPYYRNGRVHNVQICAILDFVCPWGIILSLHLPLRYCVGLERAVCTSRVNGYWWDSLLAKTKNQNSQPLPPADVCSTRLVPVGVSLLSYHVGRRIKSRSFVNARGWFRQHSTENRF